MIKLKTFSRKKSCYYCGTAHLISAEHVPPQMMFVDFECDSITVPACPIHNSSKSGNDRAIVTALVRSLDQMRISGHKANAFSSNVDKAIRLLEPNYRQANNLLSMEPYLLDAIDELAIDLPYLEADAQTPNWIKQMTAALLWSAVGEYDPATDWNSAWAWSPHFVKVVGPISTSEARKKAVRYMAAETKIDNTFTWVQGWSAHPRSYPSDIFRFEISFVKKSEDWDGKQIIFKHFFYNSIKWYVWFATSVETVRLLQEALGLSENVKATSTSS